MLLTLPAAVVEAPRRHVASQPNIHENLRTGGKTKSGILLRRGTEGSGGFEPQKSCTLTMGSKGYQLSPSSHSDRTITLVKREKKVSLPAM